MNNKIFLNMKIHNLILRLLLLVTIIVSPLSASAITGNFDDAGGGQLHKIGEFGKNAPSIKQIIKR